MDRLEAMHAFVRVADRGSFSAVAQQQGVARSVVTRQVAALEAHLGAKLLARSTRRLTLTSAGAAYLEKCRVILNLVDTAETDVAAERLAPRGSIRMSLPLNFGLKRLSALLLAFAQRYPEVALDLDFSDRRAKLIEEGFDVAIRITPNPAPGDIVRRIGTSFLRVVAAPDYLAQHGRPRHPSELAHHECLTYTAVGTPESWPFIVDGKVYRVAVRSRLQANNGVLLTEAAAQGLGIACQPDFVFDEFLSTGRVEVILADHPIPELGIYAVLPSNRHIPHRVRVLIDYLSAELAG